MKNNRKGKAGIWTSYLIKKMRSLLPTEHHKLIFEISLYTGERIGAIVQLQVSDIYDGSGKVLDEITFPGATRKASKHGLASTRQIFIHDDLRQKLKSYTPPIQGYLFPSDRSSSGHITRRAVDKMWRTILKGLGYSGYSTHSSRRWVINTMRNVGKVDIVDIAEALAININTVRRYLDKSPDACKSAIATLNV